ncbi:MAG: hypothetical protein M3511_08565 [Deinococcota bacterium]|jgi:hypothetical protein|nr:hypothetical protein [Deinococcota bacterium]
METATTGKGKVVKMTLERLAAMQSNGMRLYANPTENGEIAQLYWASTPNFINDYVVATVEDFLEAAGHPWRAKDAEITHEEVEVLGETVLTLEIDGQPPAEK